MTGKPEFPASAARILAKHARRNESMRIGAAIRRDEEFILRKEEARRRKREAEANPPIEEPMTTTAAAVCAYENCARSAVTRGWCSRHYAALRRSGAISIRRCYRTTQSRVCSAEGCEGVTFARNLCSRHYQQWWARR